MFVPVTVSVAPADPATAMVGNTEEIIAAGGVAGEIVKRTGPERTPEFDTSICTAPDEEMSEAGTMAVSCVALTKVVESVDGSAGGGFATQFTTELFTKFVPVTVKMTFEGPQDGVELLDVVDEDRVVIAGPVMVNEIVQFVTHFGAPCVSTAT